MRGDSAEPGMTEQGTGHEIEPPGELVLSEPFDVRAILKRSAPRLVRDGLGPIVAFYIGWKLVGLVVGIAFATTFALVLYRRERRLGRPALIIRVATGLVLIRAVVGLISGNTTLYLGQEVVLDFLIGSTVLGSIAVGRPLAAVFAREIYPFPSEVRGSRTLHDTFRVVTLAWGVYFIARSAVRLAALLTLTTDAYLLVAALSDAPFLVALLAWSILYTARRFRRSEEWGEALAAAERRAIEGEARLTEEAAAIVPPL
jgi:hypothetical protein